MNRWNISAWSIRKPIPSIVLFLMLSIMGVMAFRTLGVDADPNIDVPYIHVSVSMPGAAPSELESQIARKVEDGLAGLGNIKHITSTVTEGNSFTRIEFELGVNSDRALNDVRGAVTRIRAQLPQGIYEPVVEREDWAGEFSGYTVDSPGRSVVELSWLVDNEITRKLMAVPGVGRINRSGGSDREIRVELDAVKLEALGLTADAVSNQIRSLNANMPGGRGGVGSSEQSIRTIGSALTLEELKAQRIPLPLAPNGSGSGSWARLNTLGKVLDGASEPRRAALLNGKQVVAFGIERGTGTSMVEVDKGVQKELDELRKRLPSDIHITRTWTLTPFVVEAYHASLDSLIIGAVLAVFVIWLFLKDWRAAVISALAMPMSVIPTFAVLKWAGLTLNSMSLLGLALVIGILVDDAIVEIENIVRHIHMGKSAYAAALEAADEIGLAVIATTMTIIVVFLPVAFMGGVPGQYFKQFGLTVAVAVFFSLLVARLITPMMTALWMREPKAYRRGPGLFMRCYDVMMAWAMANRLATVVVAIGFFVLSIILFQTIPTGLFGDADRGMINVTLEQPPGGPLQPMIDAAQRATSILRGHNEVKQVFAAVGLTRASLWVELSARQKRTLTQHQIEDILRPELAVIPGVRYSLGNPFGMSGRLDVLLASDDSNALQKVSDQLIQEMRQLPGFFDVTSSASLQRPEILVKPDVALAAEQGISIASIAHTAMIATLGDTDLNLPRYDLPDRQIYIRVLLDPAHRENLQLISNLKVASNSGKLIPLKSVASVEMGQGPSQIDRYDRHRQVSIRSKLSTTVSLGDALTAVHNLPAFKNMPPSVHDVPFGAAEIQGEIFGGFAWALGAAVLFIYAVLVLLFSGFLQPLTIMVPLPLSIGGALMGLIIARESLGMYALIGIVMLMGLATKNSILLVEYCLMSVHQGISRDEAIMTAGEARIRPILMTTVAMIAGMLPIAMHFGADSESRAPMAIAVIGGLITSTFLTLVVVPVVYTYVDDFKCFLVRLVTRKDRGTAAEPHPSVPVPELVH